ncbi:thioredoxin domain-containing protein [Mycobacterium sp. pUA109]|uniref:thioredoxin domain-containing protein n=1 Tax=Mycobacterium sp. pUA109 TaxID=3238982 RepID=UPI00351BE902
MRLRLWSCFFGNHDHRRNLTAITAITAVAVMALCGLVAGIPLARADVAPGTTVTGDGYGVLVGAPDAPVQLEIFCEPQCPHCAQFEAASDADLARHLGSGQVAVTYRWLTFLDGKHDNDASARAATALIAAADPTTPATAYQEFVADLYRHQDADGRSATDLATMAAQNRVGPMAIARIAAALPVVDTAAMNTANRDRLTAANPDNPGTPTVYDLNAHRVVDTQDAAWLDKLVVSP